MLPHKRERNCMTLNEAKHLRNSEKGNYLYARSTRAHIHV